MNFARVVIVALSLLAQGHSYARPLHDDLRNSGCQLESTGHDAIVDCGAQRESTTSALGAVWCRLVAPAAAAIKSPQYGGTADPSRGILDWTRSLQRCHVKLQV